MNSLEAVGRVIEALEELEFRYMLVGALSSNAYGIPRSTKDADIVVELEPGNLKKLMERLGGDFRLDPQMLFETLTHSIRNVITYTPTKFDIELFRLTNDAHDAARFQRRSRRTIGELNRGAWIPTAEDVIIQKLRWQRPRDVDDARNVLAVRFHELDWDYLIHWTETHSTRDLLIRLRDELVNLKLPKDQE